MTVTLLSECAKFTACLGYILLFMDKRTALEQLVSKESLLYAVPALLYMIDNNIVYAILMYIDAAVMSIVWNCKIVITALLFRFVLKRQLSTLKWLSGVYIAVNSLHYDIDRQRSVCFGGGGGGGDNNLNGWLCLECVACLASAAPVHRRHHHSSRQDRRRGRQDVQS